MKKILRSLILALILTAALTLSLSAAIERSDYYVHFDNNGDAKSSTTFMNELCLVRGESGFYSNLMTYLSSYAGSYDLSGTLNKDLNDGAGGDHIYVGWTSTLDPTKAITGVRLLNMEKDDKTPPMTIEDDGVTWYLANAGDEGSVAPRIDNFGDYGGAVDLNDGAGGVYIYMYVTKDPSFGPALSAIHASENEENPANPADGFDKVLDFDGNWLDVNEDADGHYIYLSVETKAKTITNESIAELKDLVARADKLDSGKYDKNDGDFLNYYNTAKKTILSAWKNNSKYANSSSINQEYVDKAISNMKLVLGTMDTTIFFDAGTNGGLVRGITEFGREFEIGENPTVEIDLSSETAKKDNYTFVGWNTDKNATTGYKDKRDVNAGATLYAIFKREISANFKYFGEDSSAYGGYEEKTTSAKTTIYNNAATGKFTIPNGIPTSISSGDESYTLAGWNTDSSSYEPKLTGNQISAAHNATLHAIYSRELTLTYDTGAEVAIAHFTGTQYLSVSGAQNKIALELPSVTPPSGFKFIGWATEPGGEVKYSAGKEYILTDDTTLYAVMLDLSKLSVSVEPSSLDLGSYEHGNYAPDDLKQTFTVTNTGEYALTLLEMPTSEKYTIQTTSSTTIQPGGSITFTVMPHSTLAIGTHPETITVNMSYDLSASIDVTFKVTAPPKSITVVSAEGGSITADSSATPGETVTVTVTPDSGFSLSAIATTPADLELTPGAGNTYTFVMPNADVTLTPSFTQSAVSQSYQIWLSGTQITSNNCSSDPSWSYDAETKVLTLKGSGDVTLPAATEGDCEGFAIYADSSALSEIKLDGAESYTISGITVLDDDYTNGALKITAVGSPDLTLSSGDWFALKMSGSTNPVTITGVNNLTLEQTGPASSSVVKGALTASVLGNVTVSTNTANPALNGDLTLNAGGDFDITNVGGGYLAYNLDVTAKNITIAGMSQIPAVTGNSTLSASGDVSISNTNYLIVNGILTIKNAANVTLSANAPSPLVLGGASINASGDVKITNSGSGQIFSSSSSISAKNIEITTSTTSTAFPELTLTATEDVSIKNLIASNVPITTTKLTVTSARNVTVSGNTSAPLLVGGFDLSLSGKLSLTNSGAGTILNANSSSLSVKSGSDDAVTYDESPYVGSITHSESGLNLMVSTAADGSEAAAWDGDDPAGYRSMTLEPKAPSAPDAELQQGSGTPDGFDSNEWYDSKDSLIPPSGYTISTAENGEFTEALPLGELNLTDGEQNVTYYLKDEAGQIFEKTFENLKYDGTAPTLVLNVEIADGDLFTVTAVATDASSGVDASTLLFAGAPNGTASGMTYSFAGTPGETYTVTAGINDIAGNSGAASVEIKLLPAESIAQLSESFEPLEPITIANAPEGSYIITYEALDSGAALDNGKPLTAGSYRYTIKGQNGYYAQRSGTLTVLPHVHDYSYTADGAVITESCSCEHSETATLKAPAELTYDGGAKAASVDYSDGWQGGELTVAYAVKGGAALTSAPTDAGDYTASIEIENASASVDFAISAKALPAPTELSWNDRTAVWSAVTNASSYSLQLFLDGAPLGEAISLSETSYTLAITEPGAYSFKVKAIGSGNYSDSAEAESEIRNFYSVVWNNADGAELDSAIIAEGETPVYSGETPTQASTEDYRYSFKGWTPEIAPASANSVYTAVYDSIARITKPTADLRVFTYNGSAQTYEIPANAAYTVTGATQTAAGNYEVRVELNDNTVSEWKDGSTDDLIFAFSIDRKDITDAEITLAAQPTYNGYEQTQQVASVKIDGLDATFTVSGNTATEVGESDYTLTITGSGSFKGSATAKWNLKKATYDMSSVRFKDASYTYDGEPKTLEITGTLPEGVSVSYSTNTLTDSGSIEVTATFEGDARNYYEIPSKSAKLTITNATFTVAASGYDGVYDAQPHSITVTADGATLVYSTDDETYSAELPSFTNAGVYTVYYRASKPNHDDVTGSLTVSIAKTIPTLTITPSESSFFGGGRVVLTVSGAPSEGSYNVTVSPELAMSSDGSFNLPNRNAHYTFTAVYAESRNYTSASASCSVTVDKHSPIINPIYHTLSFDSNEGSAVAPVTAAYGRVISLDAYTSIREGFVFEGWYADEALTTPISSVKLTSEITVYAGWTELEQPLPEPIVNPFEDISELNWYYEDVMDVFEQGLMNGTSLDRFSPELTTTRGMIVTILYRMEGSPNVDELKNPFTDLYSAWYTDAVKWGAENGIILGYGDGRFGPDDPITREQMAAILWRYAGFKSIDTSSETDLSVFSDGDRASVYAVEALSWSCGEGIITGRPGGILDPLGGAQRCEVATMLSRFLRLG